MVEKYKGIMCPPNPAGSRESPINAEASHQLALLGVFVEWLGGNCPVQAEGSVSGKEFYFRSRGDSWSMSIGGPDVVGEPEWYYEEDYGEWPDAGWITDEEAIAFIAKAAGLYHAAQPSDLPPTSDDLPNEGISPNGGHLNV